MKIGIGIITISILWACNSTPTSLLDPDPFDPPVLDQARLCKVQDSLLQLAAPFPTIDQEFSVLATLLPGGFGGLASGGMFLVFPTREPSTRQVAATLNQCLGRRVSFLPAIASAIVRQGQYDWLQLSTWRGRIESDNTLELVYSDTDEATNRLGIGVPSESARQLLLARLPVLRIPTAAVMVSITPPSQPLASRLTRACSSRAPNASAAAGYLRSGSAAASAGARC